MWNIGSGSQNRSSGVIRNFVRPPTTAVRTSGSCDITQPLGIAVVPDVYIISAGSRIDVRRWRVQHLVVV